MQEWVAVDWREMFMKFMSIRGTTHLTQLQAIFCYRVIDIGIPKQL
jgi:hypothetical protein